MDSSWSGSGSGSGSGARTYGKGRAGNSAKGTQLSAEVVSRRGAAAEVVDFKGGTSLTQRSALEGRAPTENKVESDGMESGVTPPPCQLDQSLQPPPQQPHQQPTQLHPLPLQLEAILKSQVAPSHEARAVGVEGSRQQKGSAQVVTAPDEKEGGEESAYVDAEEGSEEEQDLYFDAEEEEDGFDEMMREANLLVQAPQGRAGVVAGW